ncbi:MAG: hypothetical protein H7145_21645 [Akkermansiaceae bacterium]|nr:hypothetical protein [Armatimonadota bacterium]
MRIILKPGGFLVVIAALCGLGAIAFKGILSRDTEPSVVSIAPANPNIAVNPAMTVVSKEAAGLPEGWGMLWTGRGKVFARQDRKNYHSTPASLRIDSDKTGGYGQIAQYFGAKSGDRFKVKGFFRKAGSVYAAAGMQSFAGGGVPIGFDTIIAGDDREDWRYFEKIVTVPPKAEGFSVVLSVDARDNYGTAWMDDLVVIPLP